jgi:hypothetical protein
MKKTFKPELGDDSINVAATASGEGATEVPAWKGYSRWHLDSVHHRLYSDRFKPYSSWFNVGVIAWSAHRTNQHRMYAAQTTLRNLDWNTLIILAAAQGFAKGLDVSAAAR